MSDMRVVGRTYYGEEIYEGDEVVRTPNGDMLFPDELETYALTEDDYELFEPSYDEIQKQEKLRHADMITDMKRDENFND